MKKSFAFVTRRCGWRVSNANGASAARARRLLQALTKRLRNMPGIEITSTSSQLDQLRDTFRKYAAWNHRDGAQLFLDQARKLATELYQQTAAIAPTKAEIDSDVKTLGWHIPRRFPDGRLGRGVPAQWLGTARKKSKQSKRKRGRPRKGETAAYRQTEEDFMAQKPTLKQMQDFVISNRAAARLYLASGWLGAVVDLGGSMKVTSGKVDRARGGAIIRKGPAGVEIEFWNRTPGIETMDARTQFVAKAILVRSLDMYAYIRRKQSEAAQKLKAA